MVLRCRALSLCTLAGSFSGPDKGIVNRFAGKSPLPVIQAATIPSGALRGGPLENLDLHVSSGTRHCIRSAFSVGCAEPLESRPGHCLAKCSIPVHAGRWCGRRWSRRGSGAGLADVYLPRDVPGQHDSREVGQRKLQYFVRRPGIRDASVSSRVWQCILAPVQRQRQWTDPDRHRSRRHTALLLSRPLL